MKRWICGIKFQTRVELIDLSGNGQSIGYIIVCMTFKAYFIQTLRVGYLKAARINPCDTVIWAGDSIGVLRGICIYLMRIVTILTLDMDRNIIERKVLGCVMSTRSVLHRMPERLCDFVLDVCCRHIAVVAYQTIVFLKDML